jgi:hypothetical protein
MGFKPLLLIPLKSTIFDARQYNAKLAGEIPTKGRKGAKQGVFHTFARRPRSLPVGIQVATSRDSRAMDYSTQG